VCPQPVCFCPSLGHGPGKREREVVRKGEREAGRKEGRKRKTDREEEGDEIERTRK
jgi:hypothetical protein